MSLTPGSLFNTSRVSDFSRMHAVCHMILRHLCAVNLDNTKVNTGEGKTGVVCSILLWDIKQNIMCGIWNAMFVPLTDGKVIM